MKPSVRLLAFLLSILMLIPMLSLTALGAIEEKVYGEENFDGLTKGEALATTDKIHRVPTYASVEERESGDLYASVPFRGRVTTTSDYEGNPDKSVILKNSAASWTDGTMVLSIDYYLHYK